MIPRYLKILVLAIMASYLLFKNYKKLFGIFVLAIIFSLGQWALPNGFQWPVVVSFSKYIFPLVLFQFFNLETRKKQKTAFLNVFEGLVVLDCFLVFLGFIFKIHIFENYSEMRFGYNGLLIISATATYFFITALCYFLVRYKENVLKNWRFWLVVSACVFLGTKSIYLALAAVAVFYVFNFIKVKVLKYSLIGLLLIGVFGFAYYLFFINPVFEQLRKSDGLLTSIFSFRDQFFLKETLPFIQNNWTWPNYLFGGISNLFSRTQMAFVDLVYFWGIVGAVIYGFFFLKSYITFQFKKKHVIFCLLLLFAIAFLAGNFFFNASVPIYLLVLREAFLHSENKPWFYVYFCRYSFRLTFYAAKTPIPQNQNWQPFHAGNPAIGRQNHWK